VHSGIRDTIAKLIPMGSQGFPMTIKKALEIEPDLKKLYEKDPEAREVLDLARKIEGRVRHVGVHAAGVVIAPEPLNHFVPIQLDQKTGKFITQYEMKSVGEDGVGLLKFDFLGIKNLAILADAVKRVKKIRDIDIDIENIPLDDRQRSNYGSLPAQRLGHDSVPQAAEAFFNPRHQRDGGALSPGPNGNDPDLH
jgi:DNA polymerase III subunit alpha